MGKSYRGSKSRGKSTKISRESKVERDDRPRGGKRFFKDDVPDGGKASSLNDISWYSRNPNLLAAAGSFPYPHRPGMQLDLIDPASGKYVTDPYIPGVLRIDWTPSFGNSSTSLDPASVAGTEFYGRVRDSYSGTLDADAPDFMVYVGALDSIFTYIGWLKRVYRTISTYSADNFALPEGLMRAYNIPLAQQKELRQNKTRFWQGINELILKSRKYRCPAVMDLFNRHYWMSDNVYADAPTVRSQLFVFNLIAVYKASQVEEASTKEPVEGLVMTPIPTTPVSGADYVNQLIQFGEDLIKALDTWDDGYLISGYLMRAFEGTNSFTVAELMQDELITSQYVPEVLSQIENLRVAMWWPSITYQSADILKQIRVTQNVSTNAVVSNVNLTFTELEAYAPYIHAIVDNIGAAAIKPMINLRADVPTVADTVIASRLQSNVLTTITSDNKVSLDIVAGTEIAWTLWSINYNGTGWVGGTIYQFVPIDAVPTGGSAVTPANAMKATLEMEQFDWHPILYAVVGASNAIVIVGDTNNPTTVTRDMLSNLHKICFYSEFNSFGI